MPGFSSGGVLGKNSTPKIPDDYDVIKMWHGTAKIPILAYLAYLEKRLS